MRIKQNENFKISKSSSKSGSLPNANKYITAKTIRLIGADGEMVGVVSLEEGLKQASSVDLDLVEISPMAEPPVCKIMDFGRYKYEAKKKILNSKKNQKVSVIKEIKLRPVISDHDLQIKAKHIIKFLNEGSKVKVSLKFKGREITHDELGFKILEKIKVEIEQYGKVESEAKFEGKQLIMILSPLAKK